MTPPEAAPVSQQAEGRADPAVSSCPAPAAKPRRKSLPVLKKRSEFLAAARARRVPTAGFLLQARKRSPEEHAASLGTADVDAIRVGYTCSKKLGNAVTRNRAKRRLRAIAHEVLRHKGRPGWDYVLVGKPQATVSRDFAALCRDLEQALARLHGDLHGDERA